MSRIIKKQKVVAHPMEKVLDIEEDTTVLESQEVIHTETVQAIQYDDKDMEIEKQLQEVYDTAMTQFEIQSGITELVEGKYAARNAEVAAQFLNTALNAVNTKATVKAGKDKLKTFASKDGTVTNNNLVVTDRNELLKILSKK